MAARDSVSRERNPQPEAEHVDVLIVGAGISGIGTACHLQKHCPSKSFALLEGRADIGGTWDLFRYPGIRSDSDMHTLGFSFKPWNDAKAIADGPSIKRYLDETVDEYGLRPHIRFHHLVESASWSSESARWTLVAKVGDSGEKRVLTCNFLSMCSGYYSYKEGYKPEMPGQETFAGDWIHPQEWPEDLDYTDKRVVVIGSGATAMTLVPAMAPDAAHVTMVQRSPTYVVSRPDEDRVANSLRAVLPQQLAYDITRWKNISFQQFMYRQTRVKPEKVKKKLLDMARKELDELGDSFDFDKHFVPHYNPWDQRLCLVPNSDLFDTLRSRKASVTTGQIETFTPTGLRMESGEEIEADIVVSATGLNLVVLGEMVFSVDGEPIDFSRTWTYKGMMYSDVPNMVSTFGYINASWTLRADLTAEYVCRVLNHMDETKTSQCTPRLRESDRNMPERPWIDDFSAGYMQRSMDMFPRQGDREPWMNPQNYKADKKMIRKAPIDDGCLLFSEARSSEVVEEPGVAAAAGS